MDNTNTLYLGAGCFWHGELTYSQQKGVTETEVGWCNYDIAEQKKQGRVEVVKVNFDPIETSIADLVTGFWNSHDSTSKRNEDKFYVEKSMLFATDEEQYQVLKQLLQKRKKEEPETLTEVAMMDQYQRAPEKDQKYYFKQK